MKERWRIALIALGAGANALLLSENMSLFFGVILWGEPSSRNTYHLAIALWVLSIVVAVFAKARWPYALMSSVIVAHGYFGITERAYYLLWAPQKYLVLSVGVALCATIHLLLSRKLSEVAILYGCLMFAIVPVGIQYAIIAIVH